MRRGGLLIWVRLGLLCALAVRAEAQKSAAAFTAVAGLESAPGARPHKGHVQFPPAVLWLKPLGRTAELPFVPRGNYVLSQKNKMFSPHLLVVPVGASVEFPNRDPFFHNVFSLYNGERFDLGLYQAGKSKSVRFFHEGVSYIFCNIHPEMSAVVLALTTPLFSIADPQGRFRIEDAPAGDYELHLWVEGEPQTVLDGWTREVRISKPDQDLGRFALPAALPQAQHTNEFGQPYAPEPDRPY